MSNIPALVLASSSAYRRMLLDRLRLPYAIEVPDIDETALHGESPAGTAGRLAEAKAEAVAARCPDAMIIGSDQVAAMGDVRLGKPGSHEAALEQLMTMRGQSVVFHTAVCLLDARSGRRWLQCIPTDVRFRDYTEPQAQRYLQIDEPYDCAGSAKIEAMGIALLREVVSSDPTALIGLPLIALVGMLSEAGIEVL